MKSRQRTLFLTLPPTPTPIPNRGFFNFRSMMDRVEMLRGGSTRDNLNQKTWCIQGRTFLSQSTFLLLRFSKPPQLTLSCRSSPSPQATPTHCSHQVRTWDQVSSIFVFPVKSPFQSLRKNIPEHEEFHGPAKKVKLH